MAKKSTAQPLPVMSLHGDAPTFATRTLAELAACRWPDNPKSHHLPTLRGLIKRFGFINPCVIDSGTGLLTAGHGRLEALEAMKADGEPAPHGVQVNSVTGEWVVTVVWRAFASRDEAEAYLLADNRAPELGGWDQDKLSVMMADLEKRTVNLDGLGWSAAERTALQAAIDTVPEVIAPPEAASAKPPEDKILGYVNSAIRQLVLHFAMTDYVRVVGMLDTLRASRGVKTNAELIDLLLTEESTRRVAP